MAQRQKRSETTRSKLMKAFRDTILTRGYEATTIDDILAATGLSKGALYHHFASKAEMMEAIYEDESHRAISRALAGASGEASPLQRLRAAFIAWTQEVRSKRTSKILFELGPSALGAQRAKEIESANSLIHIEALLKEAVAARELKPLDTALFASMLNALVAEAALYTLRTGKDAGDILDMMMKAVLSSVRPNS